MGQRQTLDIYRHYDLHIFKIKSISVEVLIPPIDGNWGPWGESDPCTVTCGPNGTRTRRRDCNNPPPNGGQFCIGSDQETLECALTPCLPGK